MQTDPSFRPPQKPRTGLFIGTRTVIALIMREMSTTYGRSPGGYLWAVVEPVAAIAIFSIAFSAFAHNPPLGINFPVFYATGMIPFTLYGAISGKIATSLLFSRQLLAYPRVTYLDAILARFLTNLFTEVMVAYLVFTGLLIIYQDRTAPDIPLIGLSLLLAGGLGLGVGTLNCFLMTRFAIWQRAWSIAMRPLFLVSGIFYLFETVPEPLRGWLWFNPLVHIVGLMRRGFYPVYDGTYVSVSYVVAVSTVSGLTGMFFLQRYHRDMLET